MLVRSQRRRIRHDVMSSLGVATALGVLLAAPGCVDIVASDVSHTERDERQFTRLDRALSAFPDLPVLARDHVRAAGIIRSLRGKVQAITPWQALLWAVAERLPAVVWSSGRSWQSLATHGCPVSVAVPA